MASIIRLSDDSIGFLLITKSVVLFYRPGPRFIHGRRLHHSFRKNRIALEIFCGIEILAKGNDKITKELCNNYVSEFCGELTPKNKEMNY